MTERLQKLYVEDILREIDFIVEFTAEINSAEQLQADYKTMHACIYSLEVIGEASKCVFPQTKALHPEISWKEMAGTRDVLIHNYPGVRIETLWHTLHDSIPALRPQIAKLLGEL